MSDIQREQLEAFIDAHSKSATALEKITGAIESIARTQEKLVGTTEALSRMEENQKEMKELMTKGFSDILDDKLNNSDMARDITHVKWFISIVGIVVIVCMVILRLMGDNVTSNVTTMQTKILQNIISQQSHGEPKDASQQSE